MSNGFNWSLSAEAYDSAYFSRLWTLVKSRKWSITVLVVLLTLITSINALFEIPFYVSEYSLQVDPYSMGKSMSTQPLLSNDLMSGKSMVNSASSMLRSDIFQASLAEEIQALAMKDELIIVPEINFGLKINYALKRLGLKKTVSFNKLDLTTVKSDKLGSMLGMMIETIPIVADKMLILRVTALEPRTAYLINKSVMAAYEKANASMKKKQLETSIGFYESQVKIARQRLDETSDSVTQFLRAYPMLASDSTRVSFLQDYNNQKAKSEQIKQEIEMNKQLYDYYKGKYLSFDKASDANLDLINRQKQELIELKYKRDMYREKGYDPKNPGIVMLNDEIAKIESLISKSNSHFSENSGRDIVSITYLERISHRLEELQDAIRVGKFNLQGVEANIERLKPQVNTVLQQTITLQTLQREADLSGDIFKDWTKKLQAAKSRADGEESVIAAMNEPTLPLRPLNLPAARKIFFAFLIGIALGLSIVLLKETFSPKVIDRHSVEHIGYKYGGVLDNQIANQAEILSGLGCLEDPKAGKGPKIILCASPKEDIGVGQLNILSGYLSKSKRKILTIVVSDAAIPSDYQITDDMGYAKIYRQPGGFEDLVQITDPDTFSSMRSLLDQFGSKYQVIFIFVAEAMSNLGYHMAQRVAKQLLLMGEMGEHSAHDYQRLVRGFSNPSEVYVVLIPPKNEVRKLWSSKIFGKEKSGGGTPPPASGIETAA